MTRAEAIDAIGRAQSRLVVADLHPLSAAEADKLALDLAGVRRAIAEQPDQPADEILTEGQWGLLAAAELQLYGDGKTWHGQLGITDVVSRTESGPQFAMWGEAYSNASSAMGAADETALQIECARRVAAAQSALAFGSES